MSKSKAAPICWSSIRSGFKPVFVSYFTDLFYMREAYELVRTLQVFGVDFVVEQVANLGSWEANTNHKPTFLLRMKERFGSRPVVWVDADARLRARPDLLDGLDLEEATVAYHTFKGLKCASGTVWLGVTEFVNPLLERWAAEVKRAPASTDQVCLGRACIAIKELHRVELPESYCAIFDATDNQVPDPMRPVVIEHMQASRVARRRV